MNGVDRVGWVGSQAVAVAVPQSALQPYPIPTPKQCSLKISLMLFAGIDDRSFPYTGKLHYNSFLTNIASLSSGSFPSPTPRGDSNPQPPNGTGRECARNEPRPTPTVGRSDVGDAVPTCVRQSRVIIVFVDLTVGTR